MSCVDVTLVALTGTVPLVLKRKTTGTISHRPSMSVVVPSWSIEGKIGAFG